MQGRASPRVAAKPKKNHSQPPELVSSSESGSSSGSDSAPSSNKRKPIAVTPQKKKKPRGPSSARLDEQLQEVHAENVGASLTTSARLQRKMDAQMRLNEVCYAGLTNCRTPACSESWTPSSNWTRSSWKPSSNSTRCVLWKLHTLSFVNFKLFSNSGLHFH